MPLILESVAGREAPRAKKKIKKNRRLAYFLSLGTTIKTAQYNFTILNKILSATVAVFLISSSAYILQGGNQ